MPGDIPSKVVSKVMEGDINNCTVQAESDGRKGSERENEALYVRRQ